MTSTRFSATLLVFVLAVSACTTRSEPAAGGPTAGSLPTQPPQPTTTTTMHEDFFGASVSVFDLRPGGAWLTVANSTNVVTAAVEEMVDEVDIVGWGRHQVWRVDVETVVLGDMEPGRVELIWPSQRSGLYPQILPLRVGERVTFSIAPIVFAPGVVSSNTFAVTYGEAGAFRAPSGVDVDVLGQGSDLLGVDIQSAINPSADYARVFTHLVAEVMPTGSAVKGSFLGWDYVDISLDVQELILDQAGWLEFDPTIKDELTLRLTPDEANAWLADPRARTVWLAKAGAAPPGEELPWIPSGGTLALLAEPVVDAQGALELFESATALVQAESAARKGFITERVDQLPMLTATGEPSPLTDEQIQQRYAEMTSRDIVIRKGALTIVFDAWFFAQLDELGRVAVVEAGEQILEGSFEDMIKVSTEGDITFLTINDVSGQELVEISMDEINDAANALAREYGLAD